MCTRNYSVRMQQRCLAWRNAIYEAKLFGLHLCIFNYVIKFSLRGIKVFSPIATCVSYSISASTFKMLNIHVIYHSETLSDTYLYTLQSCFLKHEICLFCVFNYTRITRFALRIIGETTTETQVTFMQQTLKIIQMTYLLLI